MDATGCCDCGGDNRFEFSVRTHSAALKSEKSRAICACTKCQLVASSHRAEVFLFDSNRFSSTGSALLNCNDADCQSVSDGNRVAIMICDVCKLCVGFRYLDFKITALSRRVVKPSESFQTIPAATLSQYCTKHFAGTSRTLSCQAH